MTAESDERVPLSAISPGSLESWAVESRSPILARPPWLRLRADRIRLPNGTVVDPFYVIDQPDYAVIAAVTLEAELLRLWSYQHGPGRVCMGLPAGRIEPGEEPIAAAQRELREETGYESADWSKLGAFVADGNRGCGTAHVFMAMGAHRVAEPDLGDLEEMVIEPMAPRVLRFHIRARDVGSLGHATGIMLALDELADRAGATSRGQIE